jgi:hypothetical protein
MADFSSVAGGDIDLDALLRGSSGLATTDDGGNYAGDGDDDDDDEDPYKELLTNYQNELASPELLPHASTESISLLIKNQTLVCAATPKGPIEALKLRILKSELERVKYIYVDYLRTRIRKIETHFLYYSKKYPAGTCKDTFVRYMSDQEWKFCEGFKGLVQGHMHEQVLKGHHANFQGFEDEEMIDEPHTDAYVFGSVVKKGDEDDEDEADDGTVESASVGDMLVVRWDLIKHKVQKGEIDLIV